METLLSGLQELHDQGVTEVMLFLCTTTCWHLPQLILELAEDHRKVFPGNEFTIVPAFITNHLQNLADFYKGQKVMTMIICFLTNSGRHIRKTDNHIVKLTDLVAIRLTERTVIMLRNDKTGCQIIRYSEGKYRPFNPVSGRQSTLPHGCRSEQNA
jgi:hypothetical protein